MPSIILKESVIEFIFLNRNSMTNDLRVICVCAFVWVDVPVMLMQATIFIVPVPWWTFAY